MNKKIRLSIIAILFGSVLVVPVVFGLSIATGFVPSLTRSFGIGSTDAATGGEVAAWQIFLVGQNKGPKALVLGNAFVRGVQTGYFGRLTGEATIEWQVSKGIAPTCQCVGPRTRAAVANLGQSQEQLRFVAPNGGEILNIGQTYRIHLTGPAVIPQGYGLVISLTGGPTIGRITATPIIVGKQYNWQINRVFPSDYGVQIQPGNYKLQVILYDDGYLCLGFCPPPAPQERLAQIVAQDESDATFQIVAASGPTITSISPTSGPRNSLVTITGSGFTSTNNTIKFTGNYIKVVTGIASTNGTSLTFSVPATIDPPFELPLGIYSVSVMNSNGTSNSVNFTVTSGTSATAPTISSISPAFGAVGTTVVLRGNNFNASNNRIWMQRERPGGYPLAIIGNPTLVDNSTLQFVVPTTGITAPAPPCVGCESATGPLSAGLYKVNVLNDFGTGVSNLVDFTVTGGQTSFAPTITNISPTSGPIGTQITITGSGFTSTGNQINFDFSANSMGALWNSLNSSNGSTLSFTMPATNGYVCVVGPCPLTLSVNPGLHKISVTNANGTSNEVNFTVTATSTY